MEKKIFDAHFHPYLHAEENMSRYPGVADTPEDVFEGLKRAGFSKACGSVIAKLEPKSFSDIQVLNEAAWELACQRKEFYIPGIHVHPDFPKESCEELIRYSRLGVHHIGELVPYMMNWNEKGYASYELDEVFELAGELGMTVSVHPTDDRDLESMARKHPHTIFIVAHPREKEEFEAHLDRMKQYSNLYLDISGTGLFRYGMLRHGVDAVGSERFLFGTDYPICNPLMQVAGVEFERLSTKDYENIFWNNAERLLLKF